MRDTDDSAIVPKLAEKCAHLRIFEDEDGKLNRSAVELGYSALVVSNFTLYGDTSRGKRPSFIHAARGELAVPCYEKFLEEMSHQGLKDLQHGEFGADMKIDLVNDGPVTIVIDTDEWKKVRAIPHNSKCRYGERGAAAAKPKAQIILDVLSSILATQMPCHSRRSGA